MIILGIETSCDETAASIYCTEEGMLSNVLFSQTQLHKPYGGVVPEIASRSHIERIPHIIRESCENATIKLTDVDAIAVTNRPGLPGSLLVGLCFAKSLAYALEKPIIDIDHVHAHAVSPLIENNVPFPHICLTASGGHTSIFRITSPLELDSIGTTQDDAAGEAFDKVAKLINLEYPGGPEIEKLARAAKFEDFFRYPRLKSKTLDFSFSGLKTAVLYDLIKRGAYDIATKSFDDSNDDTLKMRVASSFIVCVADIMVDRIERACQLFPDTKAITFAGGVACNSYLADRLRTCATKNRLLFFNPTRQYCTDNGAMVAYVGAQKALKGLFADLALDLE